jgi:hypothetical protein
MWSIRSAPVAERGADATGELAELLRPALGVRLDQDHRRRRARNSAIQAAQRSPIQIGVSRT